MPQEFKHKMQLIVYTFKIFRTSISMLTGTLGSRREGSTEEGLQLDVKAEKNSNKIFSEKAMRNLMIFAAIRKRSAHS